MITYYDSAFIYSVSTSDWADSPWLPPSWTYALLSWYPFGCWQGLRLASGQQNKAKVMGSTWSPLLSHTYHHKISLAGSFFFLAGFKDASFHVVGCRCWKPTWPGAMGDFLLLRAASSLQLVINRSPLNHSHKEPNSDNQSVFFILSTN